MSRTFSICVLSVIVNLSMAVYCLAATTTSVSPHTPLYHRLGEKTGITKLVGVFVDSVSTDEELLANPNFKQAAQHVNKAQVKARLSDKLCYETGGPCKKQEQPIIEKVEPKVSLNPLEWMSVIGDANHALDVCKVSSTEKSELMNLLLHSIK